MTNYRALFAERYGTAALSDAAFRAGAPLGVAPAGLVPLEPQDKLAGPAVAVEANNDLVSILGAVHEAREGNVVVIANRTREVALIGDLIAAEAARKGLGGFVIDALVRDRLELQRLGVPVCCRGVIPVGPLKLSPALKGVGQANVAVQLGQATVNPGDWAFGDADGVLFLAEADLASVFEQAETTWEREEALAEAIRSGEALGDLLGVDPFLEKRAQDPQADFNRHLAERGRAI